MEEINHNRLPHLLVCLFILIALTYTNTLHSPLNFDDSLVIKTEIAQSGEKYFQPFPLRYRHLFYLSLAINYSHGELNPFGYHLINISLHFFTTLAVFFISYITLKRGTHWGKQAVPIASLTALLFVLSPVHTETVTYISGRSSGLSGFFFFSSLLFFILASFRERTPSMRVFCSLLSALFFAAAILSKETSLTLPAVILLYDLCFMNGNQWSARKNRVLFLYLPLSICATFGVLLMQSMIFDWAQKIDFSYALQQARIIGHGIQLLLFPIGLTFDTDFPDGFFPHPTLCVGPILLIVALLIGVLKYFPKVFKFSLFCSLWFLITLAPTNSFLPRQDLLSERNLYTSSFGVYFILSTWVYALIASQGTTFRKIGVSCVVIALALHTTLLIVRNTTYRSNTALWEDTVKKAPGKSRAWNNLSHFYLMELNYGKAYKSLHRLIQSNPSKNYLAHAHSKLGVIHSRIGEFSKAIAAFKEGIQIDPLMPVNYINLAGVYAKQGKYSKAINTYERAEQLFKNNPDWENISTKLYLNKAYILFKMRLFEQAEATALTFLKLSPRSKSGHAMLGNIYTAMGKNADAAKEFSKAKKVP